MNSIHRQIQHRLAVLGNFIVTTLILAGCSGGGLGISSLLTKGTQPVDGSSLVAVTPLYHSASGIDVIALGPDGLEIEPGAVALSVTEDSPSPDVLNLNIIDNCGEFRPIYVRLRAKDTKYFLSGINRGDWAQGAKALSVPMPTPSGDLDIGITPLKGQISEHDQCINRAVWKLAFTKDRQKSLSYWLPSEKTGVPNPIALNDEHRKMHNYFPFIRPNGMDVRYQVHWNLLDNHLDVYAPGQSIDRDKIEAISSPYNPNVFNKYTYTALDNNVEFTFGFQLHGDYNQDQCVNIADMTPVGIHWKESSDYEAWEINNFSVTNPFRPSNPLNPCDPVNFIDGSMDGIIDAGRYDESNYEMGTLDPPYIGADQYENDLSPIFIHNQEAIKGFRVTFINTTSNEDLGPIEFDFNSPQRHTTPSGRVYFTLNVGLFNASDPADLGFLYDGVYNVLVEPIGIVGEGSTIGETATTLIENAFTVSEHGNPVNDITPPIWWDSNEKGILQAAAYAGEYRSVYVQFAQAREIESKVIRYEIKAKYWPIGTLKPSAAQIWNEPDIEFKDIFPGSFPPGPPYPNVPLNGFIDRQAPAQDLIYAILQPDSLAGNWIPNARLVILVTAVNTKGLTYGLVGGTGIWDPNTLINTAVGYVSYDYSPPTFEDSAPSPADNDPEDVLLVQPGAPPMRTPDPNVSDTGFMIYYGYGIDAQTGISGYRVYYKTTAHGSAGNYYFDASDLASAQYVDTRDFVSTNKFQQLQLLQRYIYIPDQIGENLFVCVHALNGEGDESVNTYARDVKLHPEDQLFKRLTISTEDRRLGAQHDSGEMAQYISDEYVSDKLIIVCAKNTMEPPPSTSTWYPNILCWQYQTGIPPLEENAWLPAPRNGGDFAINEASIDAVTNGGNETTTGVAKHSEISVEYKQLSGGLNAPLIAQVSFFAGGEFHDNPAREPCYLYSFKVDGEGQIDISTSGFSGNAYRIVDDFGLPADCVEHAFLPIDLSRSAIGVSYPWEWGRLNLATPDPDNMNSDQVIVHAPAFQDDDDFYINDSFTYPESPLYLLCNKAWGTTIEEPLDYAIILESCTYGGDYFSETSPGLAYTLWGANDYVSNPAHTNIRSLYCYVHTAADLWNHLITDPNDPSYWNNQISPLFDSGGDEIQEVYDGAWSWDINGNPMATRLNADPSGDRMGIPATITMRGSTDYIVFNGATSRSDTGLAVTINRVSPNLDVSDFPQFGWDSNGDPSHRFYDILDVSIGTGIFAQRIGQMHGFYQQSNSYTSLEGKLPSNCIPSWATDSYPPICIAFIQSSPESVDEEYPGLELWYAEIYNAYDESGPTPSNAFAVFQRVDSLDISNSESIPPAIQQEDFHPIWCSVATISGKYSDDMKTLGRRVPVIAYGVKLDSSTDGDVKIASLDYDSAKLIRLASYSDNIHLYPYDPLQGIVYGTEPGNYGVDHSGNQVFTGVYNP